MEEPSIMYRLLTLIITQSTNRPLGDEVLVIIVRMQMVVLLSVILEVKRE
jgi:hypothetical protein